MPCVAIVGDHICPMACISCVEVVICFLTKTQVGHSQRQPGSDFVDLKFDGSLALQRSFALQHRFNVSKVSAVIILLCYSQSSISNFNARVVMNLAK